MELLSKEGAEMADTPQTADRAVNKERKNKSIFRISMLPLNVRQQIYHHALVVERVFVKYFLTARYCCESPGDPNDPLASYKKPNLALLRVSRRTHKEASEIFYSENTFVVTHLGLWVSLSNSNPEFLRRIRMVRRLEYIFDGIDHRRYVGQMASITVSHIREIVPAAKAGSKAAAQMMEELFAYRTRLLASDLRQKESTTESCNAVHDRSIENVREFQWGSSLSWIRQNLQLDHLHLELEQCYCPAGCCRLAPVVMKWGEEKHWHYGPPKTIFPKGLKDEVEGECVLKAIAGRGRDRVGYKRYMNDEKWVRNEALGRKITKVVVA